MEPNLRNDEHAPTEVEREKPVTDQNHDHDVPSYTAEHTFVPPAATDQSTRPVSDNAKASAVRGGAYLPEYFVMLVLLYIVVMSVASLIGTGIHALAPVSDTGYDSYDTSAFELAWSLSALLASLPLFSWLFVRTRKVEAAVPAVKSHRWRKAFLGTFLVSQTLAIVWITGDMLYKVISPLLGETSSGSILDYFMAASGDEVWWETVASSLIAIAIISFVVFMMSDDYRSAE